LVPNDDRVYLARRDVGQQAFPLGAGLAVGGALVVVDVVPGDRPAVNGANVGGVLALAFDARALVLGIG
jgi:hypothetical protein